MSLRIRLFFLLLLSLTLGTSTWAIGPRDGGGGRGGGGDGGARGGGSVRSSVPAISHSAAHATPHFSAPAHVSRPAQVARPTFHAQPHVSARPNIGPSIGSSEHRSISRPEFSSSVPHVDGSRAAISPGARANVGRPSERSLGNFLDLPRAPAGEVHRPATLPAGRVGETARPGVERPGFDRPIRSSTGHAAVNREHANWSRLSAERNNAVRDRWHTALRRPSTLPANGNSHWHDWAGHARDHYRNFPHQHWFTNDWWRDHSHAHMWWHNHNYFDRPWGYWWTAPTWGALTAWCPGDWGNPVYYDYGTNLVFQNDGAYLNGEEIATAPEYAESAYDLANVQLPTDTDQIQWMPLGVFALSMDPDEQQPARVLQLAVSKEGLVGGTYYNPENDQTLSIQGSVDRQTQRAAWTVSDRPDVVFETGVYNLTKAEAPVLVHFGPDRTESYLLVRMDASQAE